MIDGRVIRAVDCNSEVFKRCLARITRKDASLEAEIRGALRELLFTKLDAPAGFLHLHQLKNREVSSVQRVGHSVNPWTIHVTRNDSYKASFTLEDGVAYMRICDTHDKVDKRP